MNDNLELESVWKSRLEEAKRELELAMLRLKQTEEENEIGPLSSEDYCAYRMALQAEQFALAEYCRVLRIYTDLLVHGKVPDEETGAALE